MLKNQEYFAEEKKAFMQDDMRVLFLEIMKCVQQGIFDPSTVSNRFLISILGFALQIEGEHANKTAEIIFNYLTDGESLLTPSHNAIVTFTVDTLPHFSSISDTLQVALLLFQYKKYTQAYRILKFSLIHNLITSEKLADDLIYIIHQTKNDCFTNLIDWRKYNIAYPTHEEILCLSKLGRALERVDLIDAVHAFCPKELETHAKKRAWWAVNHLLVLEAKILEENKTIKSNFSDDTLHVLVDQLRTSMLLEPKQWHPDNAGACISNLLDVIFSPLLIVEMMQKLAVFKSLFQPKFFFFQAHSAAVTWQDLKKIADKKIINFCDKNKDWSDLYQHSDVLKIMNFMDKNRNFIKKHRSYLH